MMGTSELSRLKVLVPLRAESRAMGVASALISAVILVAALARPDFRPLAVVVVFVMTAATWLLVMQLLVVRGIRRRLVAAALMPAGAEIESSGATLCRELVCAAALAAIAASGLAVQLGSGATFAGMLAGAAVQMMLQARWLARREQETRERLLRERRFWTGGWWPNYFRTPAS